MVKQPLRSGILLGLVLLTAVVYAGALAATILAVERECRRQATSRSTGD